MTVLIAALVAWVAANVAFVAFLLLRARRAGSVARHSRRRPGGTLVRVSFGRDAEGGGSAGAAGAGT
jgi:hypothetical protein